MTLKFEEAAPKMYDTPPAGKAPMEQILWFSVKPQLANEWQTKDAKLKNQPIDKGIYSWEEKMLQLFRRSRPLPEDGTDSGYG